MPIQTITRAIEAEPEPAVVYAFVADPTTIPRWAKAFADTVEHIHDAQYVVTKNGQSFHLEVCLHPSAFAIDYLRELANGKRGGAYIRITPRPLNGSVITMTVPIGPSGSESDAAQIVERELAELVQLI